MWEHAALAKFLGNRKGSLISKFRTWMHWLRNRLMVWSLVVSLHFLLSHAYSPSMCFCPCSRKLYIINGNKKLSTSTSMSLFSCVPVCIVGVLSSVMLLSFRLKLKGWGQIWKRSWWREWLLFIEKPRNGERQPSYNTRSKSWGLRKNHRRSWTAIILISMATGLVVAFLVILIMFKQ